MHFYKLMFPSYFIFLWKKNKSKRKSINIIFTIFPKLITFIIIYFLLSNERLNFIFLNLTKCKDQNLAQLLIMWIITLTTKIRIIFPPQKIIRCQSALHVIFFLTKCVITCRKNFCRAVWRMWTVVFYYYYNYHYYN